MVIKSWSSVYVVEKKEGRRWKSLFFICCVAFGDSGRVNVYKSSNQVNSKTVDTWVENDDFSKKSEASERQ